MTPSGFEHVYSSSDEDDGIVNPIIRHFLTITFRFVYAGGSHDGESKTLFFLSTVKQGLSIWMTNK